jgi:DNA polymerase
MSELNLPSREELARQAREHLEGLRAAGVEWLPAPHSAPWPAAPVRPVAAAVEVAAPSLFADEPAAPTAAGLTLEQRRVALEVLAGEVAGCTRCPGLASTRTQTVFADGQPGAELCLVGEAPGADEDAQGVPFVGAAGQMLNRILAACGLRRDEVYICNPLKCRPPGNRTPQPDEVANCRGFFERQLELVAPKFICCLGSTAVRAVLGTMQSITRLRGKFHDYRGTPVLVTYHPSYLLPHRSPEKKREVWEDMKLLMAKMGREIPKR